MNEYNLNYTKISLGDINLIILEMNEDNWNDIDYLKKAVQYIKENPESSFRLKINNGELSTELNQYMALVTLSCRITELENTNV